MKKWQNLLNYIQLGGAECSSCLQLLKQSDPSNVFNLLSMPTVMGIDPMTWASVAFNRVAGHEKILDLRVSTPYGNFTKKFLVFL